MASQDDPVKILLLLGMFGVLFFWLTSSSAINPIAGNSTIIGNQATCNLANPTNVPAACTGLARALKSISWLFFLAFPFLGWLFIRSFTGEDPEIQTGEAPDV